MQMQMQMQIQTQTITKKQRSCQHCIFINFFLPSEYHPDDLDKQAAPCQKQLLAGKAKPL